jgi:hypothetical protein
MLEERKEAEAPNSSFCAMKMFQNKDRVGQELVDTALTTTHQNQASHYQTLYQPCAGTYSSVGSFFLK